MPIIAVLLFEGRTADQKRKLVETVTDAVVKSLAPSVTRDAVKIAILEIPKTNYAVSGVLSSDKT